jgi:hypothetical protein
VLFYVQIHFSSSGAFDSSKAQDGLKEFARHPIKAIGNSINVVKGQFKDDAWRTTGRVARDAAVFAGAVIGGYLSQLLA